MALDIFVFIGHCTMVQSSVRYSELLNFKIGKFLVGNESIIFVPQNFRYWNAMQRFHKSSSQSGILVRMCSLVALQSWLEYSPRPLKDVCTYHHT